jgi:SAM-dependent methyltransferase
MHFASYYRWLVYRHLFALPQPAARLLDVGCDDGGFVAALPVVRRVALDRVPAALQRAHAAMRVCGDGLHLPFRDTLFDHVVLSDVIEHVEDDAVLVASVAHMVRPGGVLWLSTTAHRFQLFPPGITPRAEAAWGHVRKGYTPHHLLHLLGDQFTCEVVEWPELAFRHAYLLMWAAAKWLPGVARAIAALCFRLDSRLPHIQREQGHIYICATRRTLPPPTT